jgi:peptidylprolyl isomerase
MPRLPRLAALTVLLALGGVGGPGLVLTGCDSGPTICSTGQITSVDLAPGLGPEATDSSRVRVTYSGELEDGTEVFAATNETVLLANSVPPGFRQGVAGMRVNGRRRFTLPPDLGFGPNGPPGIPACAKLVFTVELLEILPATCANNGALIIDDLEVGVGDTATATSTVTVDYVVRRSDNTVVDQGTFTRRLNDGSLIEGVRQGLVGMREGGRRLLIIPPNLAYGLNGFPPSIPSCASLRFTATLIAVN